MKSGSAGQSKFAGLSAGNAGPVIHRVQHTTVGHTSLQPAVGNIAGKHSKCKPPYCRHLTTVLDISTAPSIQQIRLTNAFGSAFYSTEPFEASWITGTF